LEDGEQSHGQAHGLAHIRKAALVDRLAMEPTSKVAVTSRTCLAEDHGALIQGKLSNDGEA